MSVIKAKVTDQVLKLVEAPVIASGGVNEVRVEFEFCEKWDGFTKTAIFYQDESEFYYAFLDENNVCTVPWEVCYSDGTFNFTVVGTKGEARRTTTTIRYKVRKGIVVENMMPSEPTQNLYDQIMAAVAEMRADHNEFMEEANATYAAFMEESTANTDAFMEEANAKNAAFVEEVNADFDAFVASTEKKLTDATKHNITGVMQTAQSGLVDTYTIYYLDGSTKTFTVRNGMDGIDGYTPIKGVDYFDGKDGDKGEKGDKGTSFLYTNVDIADDYDYYLPLSNIKKPSGYTPQIGDLILAINNKVYRITNVFDNTAEISWTGIILKGDKGDKGDKGEKGDPGSGGTGTGIDLDHANVNDMILVKSVDDNGKPTEWETIDLLTSDSDILPETLISDETVGGEWAIMADGYRFNLSKPLVAGNTYKVIINGKEYTNTATPHTFHLTEGGENPTTGAAILTTDYMLLYCKEGLDPDTDYNCAFWYDGCESREPNPGYEYGAWIPATLGIYKASAEILPETYLTEEAVGGSYSYMLWRLSFNLSKPIEAGNTYTVTINGKEYTATATQETEETEDGSYAVKVILEVQDVLKVDYYEGGNPWNVGTNASIWHEGCNDITGWVPITVGISTANDNYKLHDKYLDMDGIKTSLPKIEMVATFADGTTATYKLYGEAVM